MSRLVILLGFLLFSIGVAIFSKYVLLPKMKNEADEYDQFCKENNIEGKLERFKTPIWNSVTGAVSRPGVLLELTIDLEQREFRGIIGKSQKEIIFKAGDIKKIEQTGWRGSLIFKFYLNDGSQLEWNSFSTTDRDRMDRTLKTLGFAY